MLLIILFLYTKRAAKLDIIFEKTIRYSLKSAKIFIIPTFPVFSPHRNPCYHHKHKAHIFIQIQYFSPVLNYSSIKVFIVRQVRQRYNF
jgi:hypothetical protein